MNSPIIKLIAVFILVMLMTSCVNVNYSSQLYFSENTEKNHISPQEVSTGDWITYIVATSFSESDSFINLSDHLDKIGSKLPDLEIQGWSSYTIKAFLRKENDMYGQWMCNYSNNTCNGILVASTAWDSIKKYRLLDVPIVGITYDQAMDYVAYEQNILNMCAEPSKKNKKEYRYECFLPTPAQLDSVLTVVDSANTKGCPTFNYKNSLCLNCPGSKKLKKMPVALGSGKEPVYVWAYYPQVQEVYNLVGNVAEMTSVKGIAKGGSCAHFASEASAGNNQEYSKPELWLGFRIWYRVYPK